MPTYLNPFRILGQFFNRAVVTKIEEEYSRVSYQFLMDANKPRNLMIPYTIESITKAIDFLQRRTRTRHDKDSFLIKLAQDVALMLFNEKTLEKSITGLKVLADGLQTAGWQSVFSSEMKRWM